MMTKHSSLDPIAEAQARVRLRYQRARPSHPGTPNLDKTFMRIARKNLPKKGATLAQLSLNWTDIVGAQLAKLCRPIKLSPARGGRRLSLRVIPAAATIVEHQSELIRQRVSVAAGGDITKLHLEQGPLTTTDAYRPPAPDLPLPDHVLAELHETVSQIEDEKLRAAIVALGEAVLKADTNLETSGTTPRDVLPF